jgi:hypothetical protein
MASGGPTEASYLRPRRFTRGLVGGTLVVIVVVDDIDQSDSLSHLAPRLPASPRPTRGARGHPAQQVGAVSLAAPARKGGYKSVFYAISKTILPEY